MYCIALTALTKGSRDEPPEYAHAQLEYEGVELERQQSQCASNRTFLFPIIDQYARRSCFASGINDCS